MLPRRNSTNVTSTTTSPQPTSGPPVGRGPLNTTINQQAFRAHTAETVETESPQSETPPREIPPVPPPRPTPLPHLPPRVGGLKRQSTRQNTYDTCVSAIEEYAPSIPQLPSTMPIPGSSFTQSPGHPPPTPMRNRQQFAPPGGGVGGFATGYPFQHEQTRDNSHHNTADYTYRFDTMPSARSDSDPPHYESADVTGGIHAKVWPTYNKISKEFDEKMLQKWNSDLDVLLIFAALFSAIVTAFLIRALDDLGPNYQQQSALLLHQILNGRDPSLQNLSDPTLPFKAGALAIATNCLWFASLAASLGASFGAMICKEWLTEYNGGANPVVELIRACQRQIRYRAFQRWNVHALVALLPPLLHSSVLLFFTGAVVYLWRVDERVAIAYQVIGGVFALLYFISTFLPFVTNAPFRPYSTLLFHRLSVAIGKVTIPIMDLFVHGCYLTLRYVASVILWPFAKTIVDNRALDNWYMRARTVLPGEYKHLRVWWENAFDDSLDEIDTSQKVQEEAILWLSQMPLDPPESKAVVSSLALISSSRPHRFPKSVIVFLNLTLESSFHETPSQEQTDISINCLLVLGHIKFQSVVGRNSDRDHNVGGIPVTALVAWEAQQLTIDAFNAKFTTPHSEGIRARLLTAAAWLSPAMGAEEVEWNGKKLKIQDRFEFIKTIRMMLERHVHGEKPLDGKILINLIHGMHACIPRGDYGIASSTVPFLPMLCDDYDSPWSEDEGVLRALINYALDLILPPARRKPLVERDIEFDELASELIDTLLINTTFIDVVAFGFWLIYRVPHAFKSRKTLLTDIASIWTVTNETIPEDHRERMNFHAIDAFVAVAQFHASTSGELPKLTSHTALELLKGALKYDHCRPMATYAMAMVLNLGTSSQVSAFTNGIAAESFRSTLFNVESDIEKNATEEDVLDLHIYSTLVLLKFREVEVDVGTVKALIGEMERVIGDAGDPGAIRDSEAEDIPDLNRVRWKAIYLSALLFRFVPEAEKEEGMEGFRARVGALLQSGELPLVGDCERCLEPLGMDAPGPRSPAEQRGLAHTAFEVWIGEFPLFPLAGSVTSVKTY